MFERAELDALKNRKISTYPHLAVARRRPR